MTTSDQSKTQLSRRDLLSGGTRLALGISALGAGVTKAYAMGAASEQSTANETLPLAFRSPEWNRDAMGRLLGDLDFGKQKFGWYKGTVNAVRANEKVKPLFGFEGFSFARLIDEGNGIYQKVLREVGFYTDLKTGEVMENWYNPYIDEAVPVVHIANDPFNYKLGTIIPKPPEYGGLNKEKTPDIPFLLPWQETGAGKVIMRTGIHLYYPSALQPDKWPRESSGPMNRVSEMFSYVIDGADLANPEKTSVTYSGGWGRITPWLPWMLMGQSEGHCYYDCMMGGFDDMTILSPQILAYAREHTPGYFEAPTEWDDKSYSSLENYARRQKPAPLPKAL